jgi:unsaturated rhamnogalacturonyl hydrolase
MFSDTARYQVLDCLMAMQRCSWDQGVTAAALVDLGKGDLLRVLLDDAIARQLPDGRLAESDPVALVNSGSIGEVLHDEAQRCGDPVLTAASARQRQWLLRDAPRTPDGTLLHLADRNEVWVDTVYMVVPALAAYGDHEAALAQLAGHRRRLRDDETGLWRHRWDEDAHSVVDERAWGTGNGWVAAALVRTIPRLTGAIAGQLAGELQSLLDACMKMRRADGLFGNHLDDPSSFAETTVAAMLGYAALRGVRAGLLPDRYWSIGASLVDAVGAQLDGYGRVTGACAAPHFDRPGFSPESQAFALLADAAIRRS